MSELPSYIPPVRIVPDFSDERPHAMATQMRPEGVGRVFGDYRIHKGTYSQYPLSHQRTLKKLGPVFVAVLSEKTVAFARSGLVWVHAEHRRKGLGPELMADLIQSSGGPLKHYSQGWSATLTKAAIKMHKTANEILAARGVK